MRTIGALITRTVCGALCDRSRSRFGRQRFFPPLPRGHRTV
ncbi:hypothetical protein SCAB_90171 [Streptomyces scabiei 87.22]|uniref:Uncharacterized protein n=1 Tax=Streptomyces scabiei (strain 87.22) TaxID=680198 RepID=C9Z9M4_STRSW|nr:hypothetical protein SCAB_90171 [Streptomyces scabiei 87.22]